LSPGSLKAYSSLDFQKRLSFNQRTGSRHYHQMILPSF
jgi:hypothetical protein